MTVPYRCGVGRRGAPVQDTGPYDSPTAALILLPPIHDRALQDDVQQGGPAAEIFMKQDARLHSLGGSGAPQEVRGSIGCREVL